MEGAGQKSLQLILARELASHLSTPMFLMDDKGALVFYNDAAEELIGRPFAEVGEIPSEQFGEILALSTTEGGRLRRRDSPAGIAFFQQRPAHLRLCATGYDGVRRIVDATAYPLFGDEGVMHGVVNVFWQVDDEEPAPAPNSAD
jgi:PAS domain-containing protein